MPIAPFEKAILRLLAANRNPESFVAGATVLLQEDNSHCRSQACWRKPFSNQQPYRIYDFHYANWIHK